jgi:hypothetical protein
MDINNLTEAQMRWYLARQIDALADALVEDHDANVNLALSAINTYSFLMRLSYSPVLASDDDAPPRGWTTHA